MDRMTISEALFAHMAVTGILAATVLCSYGISEVDRLYPRKQWFWVGIALVVAAAGFASGGIWTSVI